MANGRQRRPDVCPPTLEGAFWQVLDFVIQLFEPVELIQLLEIGDLASDHRFVNALGAVAVEDVRRQAAIPFAAEQFDDFGGPDVKVPRHLPGQMQFVLHTTSARTGVLRTARAMKT